MSVPDGKRPIAQRSLPPPSLAFRLNFKARNNLRVHSSWYCSRLNLNLTRWANGIKGATDLWCQAFQDWLVLVPR